MTLIRTAFANKFENSHLLKLSSLIFQQAGPFSAKKTTTIS